MVWGWPYIELNLETYQNCNLHKNLLKIPRIYLKCTLEAQNAYVISEGTLKYTNHLCISLRPVLNLKQELKSSKMFRL